MKGTGGTAQEQQKSYPDPAPASYLLLTEVRKTNVLCTDYGLGVVDDVAGVVD
jgi:hypothetical protein